MATTHVPDELASTPVPDPVEAAGVGFAPYMVPGTETVILPLRAINWGGDSLQFYLPMDHVPDPEANDAYLVIGPLRLPG